jgi:hypothetical protein
MQRNIVAVWYRKKSPIWSQRYARIDTAVPKCSVHMMRGAQPGDVLTLHHAITGLEVGSIKMKVGARMETHFLWD